MARSSAPPHERIIWEGYPSWLEHVFLFLFMGAAGVRMLLALRTGQWTVAWLYLAATGVFFTIAAAFHYSAYYQITSLRIRILNGISKRRGQEIPIDQVRTLAVRSEPLNRWFDIGSLVVTWNEGAGDSTVLKGLPDPDRIMRHLEAVISAHPASTADAGSMR